MIGFGFLIWRLVYSSKNFRVQQIIVVHYSFDSYFNTIIAPV